MVAINTADPVRAGSAVPLLYEAAFPYCELPRQAFRVPEVSPGGFDQINGIIRTRGDLNFAVVRVLVRASYIPPGSRRRRVLQAVAAWVPGAPSSVCDGERWFDRRVVQAIAGAANCTPATAAAWLAMRCMEV
jgi:hypothetical protein